MIENIDQAKERLKRIVDFYKLNDENNYDYSDKDLISIRIVLEEIERLKKENEELKHKLKLRSSYVYGCNIDSLGVDKE